MFKPFYHILKLSYFFACLMIFASSAHAEKHVSHSSHAAVLPGTWTPVLSSPSIPNFTGGTPLLLTDGSVMMQANNGSGEIWKLTPDNQGSYVNGSWTKLATLPIINGVQYAPLFYASAVLPDGRVIFEGGEYNQFVLEWTNMGAIYDPVANAWTPVAPPQVNGGPLSQIGDAPSVVLADGTFMFGSINPNATPASLGPTTFLLDPKTLTWTPSGFGKADECDEEGWTLLPNNKVLTVNANVGGFDPLIGPNLTGAQLYNPKNGTWGEDSLTVNQLSDYNNNFEMGPQVLRPDGTVFAAGATGFTSVYNYLTNTWKQGPLLPVIGEAFANLVVNSPAAAGGFYKAYLGSQPVSEVAFSITAPITATVPSNADTPVTNDLTGQIALIATDGYITGTINKGNNAAAAGAIGCIFYDSTGSDFGGINGSTLIPSVLVSFETGQILVNNLTGLFGNISSDPGPFQMACQDAPGTLLPNGNVLFAACSFGTTENDNGLPPTNFYEFDGAGLYQQPSVPDAVGIEASQFNLLVLPTGQILLTCIDTPNVMVYTPGNQSYNPDWAPVIKKVPSTVKKGETYKIKGIRFNGMSQGAMFGDDVQSATNYPVVRIKNKKSGHVFYCRTHDHSYMGVQSNRKVHTYFDVPSNIESGESTIEVIASGIPSRPKRIYVDK